MPVDERSTRWNAVVNPPNSPTNTTEKPPMNSRIGTRGLSSRSWPPETKDR
jgi:hypothetical protein